MTVLVWLLTTSQPIAHDNIKNTYTKGGFFCLTNGETVYKYPACNIFRISEPA